MKLDLGSFAFGAETQTPGGNPSWGTSLGQSKPELKLTYPGYECIIEGMIYKSIPTSKVFMPIGKGGHVYNGIEDEGIQIAAMFDKVFVNETRINANYILVIYKDSSNSWDGRRTLKYSDKIEYRVSEEQKYSNANFVAAVEDALQMEEGASWIVSDLYVANQDELHLLVGVVNPNGPEIFADNEARKKRWLEVIQANYDDNPDYLEKLELGFYKYSPLDSSIPLQQIFYGAPGTGKSHRVNQITNEHPSENVFRTTFHPDSDYSTFVGCYKPTKTQKPVRNTLGQIALDANKQEIFESVITYKFVPQTFLKAYLRAYQTDEPVFLIIEEINRGNCAQIFGDLFQLLDRKNAVSEYPIKADEDLRQFIIEELGEDSPAIANGELCLPSNLYIWATMNTSDQSLFPIDSAFKRRWEWKYMKIADMEKGYKIEVNGKHYDWWKFFDKMNDIIGTATSSEDKKLGYFFCKVKEGTTNITTEQFVSKVLFYIYGDALKDYDIKDDAFKKEEKDGKKIYYSFSDFYDAKGNVDKEMVAKLLDTFVGADENTTE